MAVDESKVKTTRSRKSKSNTKLDLTQFLSHQYLCESLTMAEVDTLLGYLTLMHVKRGEVLSEIGEVGDALYFVVDGEMALTFEDGKRENEILRAGPGEMLGEMSFFDRKPRSVRLVAKAADTQVLKLSRAMYKRIKVEHPYIAINLVEHAIISLDRMFRSVSRDFAHFSHYFFGSGKT